MTTAQAWDHDVPASQTAFAHSMMASTSSIIDALAAVGSTRHTGWSLAFDIAEDAVRQAGTPEERLVASGLLRTLQELHLKGGSF